MTSTDIDPNAVSFYERGWAAYRRGEQPASILDPKVVDAINALTRDERQPGEAKLHSEWTSGWRAAREAGEPRTDPPLPTPKPTLTITHTSAEGTMLEGTSKGDGAWDAIKAAQRAYRCRGWKYFPSIRSIGVSHSRDRAPQLGLIDQTAQVLRDAGFDVEIEIDGTPRRMEDAEADRADRMDDRADALASKATRLGGEAESRWAAADAISEHIPPGQPILVGHHSERGHRRALDRMDGHMRASLAAAEEAKLAAERAETAARHMEARTNPRRVYRRVKTLLADLGRVQRGLDGHRTRHLNGQGQPVYVFDHAPAEGRHREELEGQKAHVVEQIRYWTEALAAAKAAGADVPPDVDQIKKGDWVRSWAGWNEVTRVNKVTVTVLDSYGPGRATFPRKVTLDEIREIRATSPYEPAPAEPAVELDDQDVSWSMLRPGGELAAILPTSWESRKDRRVQALREQLGAETHPVEEGAFAGSGTNVRVVMVHAVKPDTDGALF